MSELWYLLPGAMFMTRRLSAATFLLVADCAAISNLFSIHTVSGLWPACHFFIGKQTKLGISLLSFDHIDLVV